MQKGSSPLLIVLVITVIVGLSLGGYWYLTQSKPAQKQPTSILPSSSPTPSPATLADSNLLNNLDLPTTIKIPFMRDGAIYLYEEGKEKMIAKPSKQGSCTNLVNPFLSPNGKYVAYIEQLGGEPEYGGCPEGVLRIYDINSAKNNLTNYKTNYFKWNSFNQIVLYIPGKIDQSPQTYTDKEIFYDPSTTTETVFNTIIDQDKATYANIIRTAQYPYSSDRLIQYKDKKFYLVDKTLNKEVFLLDETSGASFTGWSPDGAFVIFTVYRPGSDSGWISIDTKSTNLKSKNILVKNLAGGAGGDIPTGPKWYFNKAFILDCQQELFFVDGITQALTLTNTGGGGCHNSEGFVSTSPDGQYAFVKFADRFEIHTLSGQKTIIKESTPLEKNRFTPKNLIWINNDYMVIFERSSGSDFGTDKKPRIFLFDRKENIIKSLIENAYLY